MILTHQEFSEGDFLAFGVINSTPNTRRIIAFNSDRYIIRYLAFYGAELNTREWWQVLSLTRGYAPSISLPYRSGYTLHWYTDEAGGERFDLENARVLLNLTLHGRWVQLRTHFSP